MDSAEVAARLKSFLSDKLREAREELKGPPRQVVGESVHDVRKSIKKLRAVLRLVRKMADKEKIHPVATHLRDAAHRLGPLRDSEVLRSTIQRLKKRDEPAPRPLETGDARQALRLARAHLGKAGASLQKLIALDWESKGLKPGLRRLFKRSLQAMRKARKIRSDDDLHAWRKRTKDLYYALKLLANGGQGRARVKQLKHLTSHLGDDHDLAFLQQHVSSLPDEHAHRALLRRAGKQRRPLQKKAFREGSKLLDQGFHRFVRPVLP